MALISDEEKKVTEDSFTYANSRIKSEPSIGLSGDATRRYSSNLSVSQENVHGDDQNKRNVSRSRGTFIMLACLYMTMSGFGMMSALGVVYVELISAFQCLRSEAALVQSLYMGMMLGGGILFTKLVTKYDTGACVIFSSILSGISCACGSLALNIGTVIALVGAVLGLFASVNILVAYIVVNWTFVGNRKLALGVLTFGSTIGQTVFPYITNVLIQSYSWNGCLLILSALAYLNGVPCGLIVHYSKTSFQKADKSNSKSENESLKSFLTDGAFMAWILASFLFTLLGPVEQWFIVDVAILIGFWGSIRS